jgi:hypothetical protein
MSLSQTCRSCGKLKDIGAYERLPSGSHRGTCIGCRQTAAAARKRQRTQERRASPEHLARLAERERDRKERAAQKEAAILAQRAEVEARRTARCEAARLAREQRAALQDDIWSAMWRGRSARALQAVSPRPKGTSNIKLTNGQGFISIAELACRGPERHHRATGLVFSFPAKIRRGIA